MFFLTLNIPIGIKIRAKNEPVKKESAYHSPVKVFELMPPLVNTDFSKEIGGKNGISPVVVAQDLLNAFETGTYEVKVGQTADFHNAFFTGSEQAVVVLNEGRG